MDVLTELGLSAVARLLGCKPQSVIEWRRRGIPPERCAGLELATKGRFHCEGMRPDVAWARIPDPAWPWHPEGRPLIDVAAAAIDRQQEQGAQGQQSPAAGTSLGDEATGHRSMASEPQHAQPRAA